MAITPRSFRLNPRLILVAALAAWGLFASSQVLNHGPLPTDVERACVPSAEPMAQWAPGAWGTFVTCLSEQGRGDAAYRAATIALAYYPTDSSLLNLRGFVAARNGDHATAVYDFRTGQRITGSPDGIFENNIAFTTLFQIEPLNAERAERVLLQTRALYERSMEKRWSCERAHTALYVEYSMADLIARNYGTSDPRVKTAVDRYVSLYGDYTRCLNRAELGDELVVEELLSAAAMDAEMGRIAGVAHPTRHLIYANKALVRGRELGLELNHDWCAAAVPVASGVDACTKLF